MKGKTKDRLIDLAIFGILILAILLFGNNKIWPAEPDFDKSLKAAEKLIDETVSRFTEVEKWPLIGTSNIEGLFFITFHKDSNSDRYAITISFAKRTDDRNWNPEVFVRFFDVESMKSADLTGTRVSMKLEDGSWTPPSPGQLFKINNALNNNELGIAFRILDENGSTKFLRTFSKKDFVNQK